MSFNGTAGLLLLVLSVLTYFQQLEQRNVPCGVHEGGKRGEICIPETSTGNIAADFLIHRKTRAEDSGMDLLRDTDVAPVPNFKCKSSFNSTTVFICGLIGKNIHLSPKIFLSKRETFISFTFATNCFNFN